MGLGRKEIIKQTVTFKAAGTIVANTFVNLDSNGEVEEADDGEEIVGVALEAGVAGDFIEVATQNSGNFVKVASGAAVTQGGKVASDLNGKVINAATADIEVGQAIEGSSALDEFAIIFLTRGGTAA